MQAKEYRTEDKSEWGQGPWNDEPDKMQYVDEATGFPCLIVRNRSGALCGYVGVTKDHPAFGKEYHGVDVSVHGGLTFSDRCQVFTEAESHGVCHLVEDGEDDNVWWLGFDCAHYMDYSPAMASHLRKAAPELTAVISSNEHYRDIGYVKSEITDLARQLKEMTP